MGPMGPIGMPPPIMGKPGAPIGGGPGGMAGTEPPIAIAPGSSTTGGVFASATMLGRGFESSAKNNSRTNGSVAWGGRDCGCARITVLECLHFVMPSVLVRAIIRHGVFAESNQAPVLLHDPFTGVDRVFFAC